MTDTKQEPKITRSLTREQWHRLLIRRSPRKGQYKHCLWGCDGLESTVLPGGKEPPGGWAVVKSHTGDCPLAEIQEEE